MSLDLDPANVRRIIHLIKTDRYPSEIELHRIFTHDKFKINDYEPIIDDKFKFLDKEISIKNFQKITIRSFIEQNIKRFPNKDQILEFFEMKPAFELSEIRKWESIITSINNKELDINKLDELRKKLVAKIRDQNSGSPFYEIFIKYVSRIKSIYGDRPSEGKWTLKYLEPVIDSYGSLCTDKGNIEIIGLELIKLLANPSSPYLDNTIYVGFFEIILQYVLYTLGTNIMNMTSIAKSIVRIINDKIGYTYIVLNCKNGLESYTCGRAIASIHKMTKEKNPRLIIFNTISSENDNVDFGYYLTLVTEEPETLNLENGGESYYYKEKYLKYKNKYLQLKKNNRNL